MATSSKHEFSTISKDAAVQEWLRLEELYPQLKKVRFSKRRSFEIPEIIQQDPALTLDPHDTADLFRDAFERRVREEKAPPQDNGRQRRNHEDEEGYYYVEDREKKKPEGDTPDETEQSEKDDEAKIGDLRQDTSEMKVTEEDARRAAENGGKRENFSGAAIEGMRTISGNKELSQGKQDNSDTTQSRGHKKEGKKDTGAEHDSFLASLNDEGRKKIEELRRRYQERLRGQDGKETMPVEEAQLAAPILPSPVTRIGGGSQKSPERDRMSISDKLRLARRATGGGGGGEFGFLSRMLRPNAKNIIQGVVRVISVIPGGKIAIIVIIAIIVLLVLAFIIIMKSSDGANGEPEEPVAPPTLPGGPGGSDGPSSNPIPGLELAKAGPNQVQAGEEIEYTITAAYDGALDVLVYDPIARNAEYVSSDPPGEYDEVQRLISWRLDDFEPDFEDGELRTYQFQLTLRPAIDNTILTNQAFASASPPAGSVSPPNLEANDFESLMTGQGRNIGVLGSEDEFVEAIFANTQPHRFQGGREVYEPYIREIYRTATNNNVNPVIVLTIWGVEQSLGFVDGYEFGCLDEGLQGFDKQVKCSVDTLNHWMTTFEETAARDGLPVSQTIYETCSYWDPFLYAYEKYTPVCTMNHGNDGARSNFIIYYKEFLQGPS